MTRYVTFACENCKGTHTCTHTEEIRDDFPKTAAPIAPTTCPYFEDGGNATWFKVDTPEPKIPLEYEAKEIDALLEVIKQKDAIIDNCRSSLEEYRQKSYEYMSEIGYLKKTSDPELYKKFKDAEHKVDGLEAQLTYKKTEDGSNRPLFIFSWFVGVMIGVAMGACL